MRSYEQTCPVAVALDAIGDRWTLLILRELAIGDQRFTDLRAHLPGIAPNLLSTRLAELVERGLVAKVDVPPPVARSVYRLTSRGGDVRPVLGALARFGVRDLDLSPDRPPMRPTGAVHSLLNAYYTGPQPGVERVRVVVDDEPFDVTLRSGVRARPTPDRSGTDGDADAESGESGGAGQPPDVTVVTTVRDLLAARQEGVSLAATVTGAREAREGFARAFALDLRRGTRVPAQPGAT
jgi:DNA-binding HxlR family transcriptional regulator